VWEPRDDVLRTGIDAIHSHASQRMRHSHVESQSFLTVNLSASENMAMWASGRRSGIPAEELRGGRPRPAFCPCVPIRALPSSTGLGPVKFAAGRLPEPAFICCNTNSGVVQLITDDGPSILIKDHSLPFKINIV
jgi:hypothetical protein